MLFRQLFLVVCLYPPIENEKYQSVDGGTLLLLLVLPRVSSIHGKCPIPIGRVVFGRTKDCRARRHVERQAM